MKRSRLLLLALAVALAGCSAATGESDSQRPGRDQNLLTYEEIRASQHQSLYQVVSALRPAWLRTRGQISISDPAAGQVVVYLDGVRAGGAEYLRQVNSRDVESVQYLNETEANARFGMQQQGGGAAIVVRLLTAR